MRTPILAATLGLAALVLVPPAAAVLGHSERAVGELAHTRLVDGVVVCEAEDLFALDTRGRGLFAGRTACGEFLHDFDGCQNADLDFHYCERGHAPYARMLLWDVMVDGLWSVDVTYERHMPDGSVDRVRGTLPSVPLPYPLD